MSQPPSLTLNRWINAPRAKVYAAWTDPTQLSRWFGPATVASTDAELDVRTGGRFRIAMHGQDAQTNEVSGIYREVVRDEKLVFTWAWSTTPQRISQVTVRFQDDGAGTLLTLMHEQFFDDEARDRHASGWSQSLDKLVEHFQLEETTR